MPHRRLLQEHVYLRVLADRMRLIAAAPTSTLTAVRWRKVLEHELSGLADTLEEHFESEEQGGYMRNLVSSYPELGDRAAEFVNQHDGMRASVTSMLDAVGTGASVDDLRPALRSLLTVLAAHEAGETEMIQETLQHDTGTGD